MTGILPRLYLFFYCLMISCTLSAQKNAVSYVEEAITLMKKNSVNKGTVDWTKLSEEALTSAAGKGTAREAYPIITKSLELLQDQHSGFYPPEMVSAYMKRYTESGLEFPYSRDSLINGQLAYLSVPAIGNLNQDDWKLYVSDFYKKIKALDARNPKAWILDLRDNDGGMFSPMFKAIQPFLDSEKAVGSIDNSGRTSYYANRKNDVLFGQTVIATIEAPAITLQHKKIPIYILVSKKTASSGEFVTAAFAGQKNTTIIGTHTQGLTSDNSEFRMSDGAILKLTTGILVNRNGDQYKEVGKGIAPDRYVKSRNLQDYIAALPENR